MRTKKTAAPVEMKQLRLERVNIPLIGTAPLIMHAWSHKSKSAMLDKQLKRASTGRAIRDPQQDFEDSIYRATDGGPGFPAVAFKAAAVDAAVAMDLVKTQLRQSFHIDADMLLIVGDEPKLREDMVRVGMGAADLRYRAEFRQWGVIVPVTYNSGMMSTEQLFNLFNAGGFGIGVGEWRPQKDGQFGRFKVADDPEAKLVRQWHDARIKATAKRMRKAA